MNRQIQAQSNSVLGKRIYNVYTYSKESQMKATIQKWGNSNAIRIPKKILQSLDLKENDCVELTQTEDGFTVRKCSTELTVKQLLEDFYGQPLEMIPSVHQEELDWGQPMGEEIW